METSWKDACIGAIIQVGVGYPFELLKVRSQLDPRKSIYTDISFLYRTSGVRSFYHGARLPLMWTALSFHSMFHVMNTVESTSFFKQHVIGGEERHRQVYSGSIAGAFMAVALNPCEIMKCYNQAHIPVSWKHIVARPARGLAPHVLREFVGFGSYFQIYTDMYRLARKESTLSASWCRFLSGALAGVGSAVVSYPFDLWKTRSQVLTTMRLRDLCMKGLALTLSRSFIVNGVIFLIIGE